jgi:gas vesicle protein
MFSRVRIAIRFFFVGLAVGILLAPRSGEETRQMLRAKADELLNNILDAASMGVQPEPPAAKAPTRSTRSRNGSASRARSKVEDVAEETAEAAEAASA